MSSRLRDVARSSFARHETFAPRIGWLHKAYLCAQEDEEVFLREEAPVTLGVGKNMVSAMRYWMAAFKLTVEVPRGGTSRAYIAVPTWEARWLFGDGGADAWLERNESLWLLHWWLLSPTCSAPVWWVAFHAMPTARFTQTELADLVERQVSLAGWEATVRASVEKDADCLTKMYGQRKATANSPGSFEDMLGSPFRDLGLLESVAANRGEETTWRFTSSARTSLPASLMAYASLDYAARTTRKPGSVSVARLANEPGGPGRAFRVREPELTHALEAVCERFPDLTLMEAVGQRTLVFNRDPHDLAWDVLDAHYGNIRERAGFPTREEWIRDHPGLDASNPRTSVDGTAESVLEMAP